ncbi:hypothetical protein [Paraburkholderia sp. GAS32]|uniref:hypothetical protein n=1 Tax=Paraburkholderia sp. GAS32 TaxID=3035129 RepID=UPI003D2123EB
MTAFFSDEDREVQRRLQAALNEEPRAKQLENLAAALIGRLLGIEVATAKSGFQHGADAGPAGRQGRRFRIECKKYRETTSNKDRELLGEIDQAVARDEAIEGWILVATRSVPEQLRQDLEQHGERLGVPVIILSWVDERLSTLAALCASDPDIVGEIFSAAAGELTRKLAPVARDAIEEIKRDLQSWSLGFETLRLKSHRKLDEIWRSPRVSNAELGQDAAGGAQSKRIKRIAVSQALDAWWIGPAQNDATMVVVGADGVGKTWSTLDWIVDHISEHPIVFVVPSSAAAALKSASETAVKRFFAERCCELTGQRTVDHWIRRLDRLLARPADEGPVLTAIFDGINQEPSVPWLQVLKVLQGPTFADRVRSIVSTRPHFLTDRLASLKGLVEPAVKATVDVYGIEPGGELDQMLALEGLTRSSLHPDLVDLARTPRLFKLVIRLRDRLIDSDKVTVHRLLWEYGRDSFGERAGKSFSDNEWQQYLQDIALELRSGVNAFTLKALGEAVSRPDLTPGEVYARLSDIVDGRFTRVGPIGKIEFMPEVVAHSLAAALLTGLATRNGETYDVIDAALAQWLDPIAGLDQRAEILRAAVAILIERGDPTETPIAGALVTSWLQTQNLTDHHRRELAALSANLISPLLDAIEHSASHAQASARLWAVSALRAIPRTDIPARTAIVKRTMSWLRMISRGVRDSGVGNAKDFEEHRAQQLIDRVGVDQSGPLTILGQEMIFVDLDEGILHATVPSILDGFPLAPAVPLIEVATINATVGQWNAGSDGLRWLLVLNEADPEATAEELRRLATAMQGRSPEPGINPDLPARIAKRLLFLTGYEVDEIAARDMDSTLDGSWSYENDYVESPATSLFPLEHRHADDVLSDGTRPLHARLQRAKPFWLNPNFNPPARVVAEVRSDASSIDASKLDSAGGNSFENHAFEEIEPVLARCAPDLLADIGRRKLLTLQDATREQRYWRAIHAPHQLIISDGASRDSASALRTKFAESDEGNELYAASQLLIVEVQGEDGLTQATRMIEAGLKTVLTDFAHVVSVPTPEAADALLDRFGQGTQKQQHDLLCVLSFYSSALSDRIWSWLEIKARGDDQVDRGIAFRTLERADGERFGRLLIQWDWTWKGEEHFWVNHYGSGALISGAPSVPFEQLAPRIAPWRLLEAARMRGGDPVDIRLAVAIFGDVLTAGAVPEPDPGSDLTIELSMWSEYPSFYTLQLRKGENTSDDQFAALREAQDLEAQRRAWKRATETARQRIDDARAAGASLYLANVNVDDLTPVWTHAPEIFDHWIEGFDRLTMDFKRRVRLAETTFLAICETLLNHDPGRGVQLWHALRQLMAVQHIGEGGADELIHIAFRATDSSATDTLRTSLIDLHRCSTDKALGELAFAAVFNGRHRWLETQIEIDRTSPHVWRQKRAIFLSGFLTGDDSRAMDDWPVGPARSSVEEMKRSAARRRQDDAVARHWWRTFLAAQNSEHAYAAWVLFLQTCDRRSSVWLRRDVTASDDRGELRDKKIAHALINRSSIKRQAESREKNLNDTFLGQKIVIGVAPWGVDTTRPD